MDYSRALRQVAAGVILCGSLLVVVTGCNQQSDAQPQAQSGEAVPVTLAAARTQPVQRSVDVTGTLEGEEDVTISNKVNGRVIAIYKDVGDRVGPGEPLAQLLPNDYQRTVNLRRSALNEVLAKLGTTELPGPQFEIGGLPTVRKAKLAADNAGEKFERGKQLFQAKPPLIAEQDYEDLEIAWQTAQSGYESEMLAARALAGAAQTAQAELAIAEQALRDTTIRAPRPFTGSLAGSDEGGSEAGTPPAAATQPADPSAADRTAGDSFVVAGRFASVGELLPAITRMFRLVDDNPLKLVANVPERFVPDIRPGQKVRLTVEAYRDTFEGTVARVNPQIDPANRTFEIEVSVPNDDHRLRPGAFVKAKVLTNVQPDVVFVPMESVVSFAGVNKVFTVKDGKAVEVPVELGERQGDHVEVVKGLAANQSVVTSGTNKLATGVAVSVKADGPAAATTQPAQTAAAPAGK